MPDQPNILLIFPDQWRGDSLSSLGHPIAETPFVDGLAAQGTTFTAAYTNCPTCIAARASLITGQTPEKTGRFGYRDGVPWPYRPTLMECLRDNGYQTLMSGKTHFHPPRAHLGFEQLALYDNQRHKTGFFSDYDHWLERVTEGQVEGSAQRLQSNSQIVHPWTYDEHLHANAWTVTAALDMLERRDPLRPWFLQLGFHRPHPPYDPPIDYFNRFADVELPPEPRGAWASYLDKPDPRIDPWAGTIPPRMADRARRAYYAQLAHIDFQIGRFMRWLQLRKQHENVLVIFASDHGEQLGDHYCYRKSSPLEGAAKIPMVIRAPLTWDLPQGQRRDEPIGLHDLMPTILDAAGIGIPDTVEGKSMLPLTKGEAPKWRDYVQVEHCNGPLGAFQCLTDGKRKFAWLTESGRELFFNLEHDPQELNDLSNVPEHKEEIDVWRERLIAVLAERPEDELSDGHQLLPGKAFEFVRPWLLEAN